MRVLHLTTHLNMGGITIYILRLIQPVKALGIETFVISSGGNQEKNLKDMGAVCLDLPIRTKNILSPRLFLNIPRVIRFIRENKIDLIHAHTRVTQAMAWMIQRFIKIPVVATCHGFYKPKLGRKLFPAWGDKTIAISQGVAEHLTQDFKVPSERVILVNNGVDIEMIDRLYRNHNRSEVKIAYGFRPEDPVIGIIARLVMDKGHEYLIRAIAHLKNKFPNIRLLVVGDGNYRPHLEKLSKELGLQKNVLFLGNVSDVTKPLSAMDIFSLPATWREGFGLSIVEAMACRRPVIVSNIWALNSLILDDNTGLLIEPKQIEPLAEAIASLLKDPAKRLRIGEAGRKMTEEHFSVTRMAKEMSDVYKTALGTQD